MVAYADRCRREPGDGVAVLIGGNDEHEEAPLQAESCRALVAVQPMVAPLTGVTPSAASTRTLTGFGACVPTGVDGLSPYSRTMVSVAAAP